jgi:ABC-2 type transport system ATP-binding protein
MIRCESLTKFFNGTRALEECSFEISGPSITGVIGVNGAGKTTLFKSLAGFLKPSGGNAYVFDQPAFQNIIAAQNVILVDESMEFYPGATLKELIDSYSRFYRNFDVKLAMGLLKYFNLQQNAKYKTLSKGVRATFRLILGLSARAPITLLDEPADGMDPGVRTDLYQLILKDYVKAPRIILISSHYLGEMEPILEDILFIHEGKVLKHDGLEVFESLLIALQGPPDIIELVEKRLKVYEGKNFGEGLRRIVVDKEAYELLDLSEKLRSRLTLQGISPEGSFTHLTRREGGGINELYDS